MEDLRLFNLRSVKRAFKVLSKLTDKVNYRSFEVAYLIMERLDNVIENENDITEDLIKKVDRIADNVDTLLDYYVNEELDIIEKDLENGEEN